MCAPPRLRSPITGVDAPARDGDLGKAPSVGDVQCRLVSELARSCARRGFAIAYDLLGNRSEAEEAVQDALAHTWEAIADLRDPTSSHAWFFRVVTTTCLGVLRRRKRARLLFGWLPNRDDDNAMTDEPGSDDVDTGFAPALPAADSALAAQQAQTALLVSLGRLSPHQCTALVLRYGHGHS